MKSHGEGTIGYLFTFDLTLKAFANVSPGLGFGNPGKTRRI